ncbi:MAG: hypothetical protein ABI862_04305, partial [Ilumatobacteraceae bacterium]
PLPLGPSSAVSEPVGMSTVLCANAHQLCSFGRKTLIRMRIKMATIASVTDTAYAVVWSKFWVMEQVTIADLAAGVLPPLVAALLDDPDAWIRRPDPLGRP